MTKYLAYKELQFHSIGHQIFKALRQLVWSVSWKKEQTDLYPDY